jgi:hypothetical protein
MRGHVRLQIGDLYARLPTTCSGVRPRWTSFSRSDYRSDVNWNISSWPHQRLSLAQIRWSPEEPFWGNSRLLSRSSVTVTVRENSY